VRQSSLFSNFAIVAMSWERYELYFSWFKARDALVPAPCEDAVAVTVKGELAAVALVYPTPGPYAVVEHLATNPALSLRTRYDAVVYGAHALRSYGVMRQKLMLCFPVSRGLEGALRRAGFVEGGKVMR
jgi:hypothetical protein